MLDTNICVNIIRGKSAALLQKLTSHSISDICISAITVAELQFGTQKSALPAQNRQTLDQFLLPLIILDFDYNAATAYGQIRAYLTAEGTPIGSLDMLIAGHALSLNLTLVTNNVREFSRVPGLVTDDWTIDWTILDSRF